MTNIKTRNAPISFSQPYAPNVSIPSIYPRLPHALAFGFLIYSINAETPTFLTANKLSKSRLLRANTQIPRIPVLEVITNIKTRNAPINFSQPYAPNVSIPSIYPRLPYALAFGFLIYSINAETPTFLTANKLSKSRLLIANTQNP
jgi:hypothetical protein